MVQLAMSFSLTVYATLLGYCMNAVCRTASFMKALEELRGHVEAKSTLLAIFHESDAWLETP